MHSVAAQPESWQARRARISTYWWNKASDLRAAAGAVWYSMENSDKVAHELGLGRSFSMGIATWPVYQMLCGMALELGFKAVAVSKGKKPIATHNLIDLAEYVEGLTLKPKQKKVLAMLTESIYWEGRYPVPKKLESMNRHYDLVRATLYRPIKLGTLRGHRSLRSNPLDWDAFLKLWTLSLSGYIPASE